MKRNQDEMNGTNLAKKIIWGIHLPMILSGIVYLILLIWEIYDIIHKHK